jgi:hypothetical protein
VQADVNTLTVVLTHQDPDRVHETLDLLRLVTEENDVFVCHAGRREDFDRIEFGGKVYIDDPTLRGPARHLQSLSQVFEAVWRTRVKDDEGIDSVYVIEYDHLILDTGYEQRLRDLAVRTGADFLGKNCVDRTATNWQHYVRFRADERLLSHLRVRSVRDDPVKLFGCLGDGMWLVRSALEAYVEAAPHPPCYVEVYVPTLLHHLGFRVVDIDEHSDLYGDVRWDRPFASGEAIARLNDGAVFLHPVKDRQALRRLADALRLAQTGGFRPAAGTSRSAS